MFVVVSDSSEDRMKTFFITHQNEESLHLYNVNVGSSLLSLFCNIQISATVRGNGKLQSRRCPVMHLSRWSPTTIKTWKKKKKKKTKELLQRGCYLRTQMSANVSKRIVTFPENCQSDTLVQDVPPLAQHQLGLSPAPSDPRRTSRRWMEMDALPLQMVHSCTEGGKKTLYWQPTLSQKSFQGKWKQRYSAAVCRTAECLCQLPVERDCFAGTPASDESLVLFTASLKPGGGTGARNPQITVLLPRVCSPIMTFHFYWLNICTTVQIPLNPNEELLLLVYFKHAYSSWFDRLCTCSRRFPFI